MPGWGEVERVWVREEGEVHIHDIVIGASPPSWVQRGCDCARHATRDAGVTHGPTARGGAFDSRGMTLGSRRGGSGKGGRRCAGPLGQRWETGIRMGFGSRGVLVLWLPME